MYWVFDRNKVEKGKGGKERGSAIFLGWVSLGSFFSEKLSCPLPSSQLTQQIKGWLAQGVFLTLPRFGKWCLGGGVKASPWLGETQVLSPSPRYFYEDDKINAKSAFSSCIFSALTNILSLRPGLHEEQNQLWWSWLELRYSTCVEVLLFNQALGLIPTLGVISHIQTILLLPQTHNVQKKCITETEEWLIRGCK